MTPVQLPEVPAPADRVHVGMGGDVVWFIPDGDYYTAAQLREYATTDRASVLAAILAIIPGGSVCDPQQVADDIRAILDPSETNSER